MEFQLVQRTWAPSAGLLSPLHLRRMVLPKAAASRGFGYRDLKSLTGGTPSLRSSQRLFGCLPWI